MGVTIYGPGESHPLDGLSYEERQLRERQERRRRIDEHQARDRAYQAGRAGKALVGPPENKMLTEPAPATENKTGPADPPEDLSAKTKAELRALAVERTVDVTRADGRTDLEPTVADYRRALGG